MNFRFYINFVPVTFEVPEGVIGMLGAINAFQWAMATEELQTFTVLDVEKGYAFSQPFQITGVTDDGHRTGYHKIMFKHERGVSNPMDIPSFDDLESIPEPPPKTHKEALVELLDALEVMSSPSTTQGLCDAVAPFGQCTGTLKDGTKVDRYRHVQDAIAKARAFSESH